MPHIEPHTHLGQIRTELELINIFVFYLTFNLPNNLVAMTKQPLIAAMGIKMQHKIATHNIGVCRIGVCEHVCHNVLRTIGLGAVAQADVGKRTLQHVIVVEIACKQQVGTQGNIERTSRDAKFHKICINKLTLNVCTPFTLKQLSVKFDATVDHSTIV